MDDTTAKDHRELKAHHCQQLQFLCLSHPLLCIHLLHIHCLSLQVFLHHSFLLSFLLASHHLLDIVSLPQGSLQRQPIYQHLGYHQEYRLLIQIPSQQHKHHLSPGKNSIESNDGLKKSKYFNLKLLYTFIFWCRYLWKHFLVFLISTKKNHVEIEPKT